MRAFIAIEMPDLKSVQKHFKTDGIKLTKNFHLTLKFLGEYSEKEIQELDKKLNELEFEPFELEYDKIGVFPGEHYIRVIWAGVKESQKLNELKSKIDEITWDDDKFSSHVTLGRVKFLRDKEKIKQEIGKPVSGKCLVNEIKLIKSELTREGPIYKELGSYKAKN